MGGHVQDGAAPGGLPVEAPGHGGGGVEGVVGEEVGAGEVRGADSAVPHGVPQLGDRGKAAVGEADGGDAASPIGDLDQLGGLGAGAPERLLAQDVLARPEQGAEDWDGQEAGQRDRDDLDLGGVQDLGDVGRGAGESVAAGLDSSVSKLVNVLK